MPMAVAEATLSPEASIATEIETLEASDAVTRATEFGPVALTETDEKPSSRELPIGMRGM